MFPSEPQSSAPPRLSHRIKEKLSFDEWSNRSCRLMWDPSAWFLSRDTTGTLGRSLIVVEALLCLGGCLPASLASPPQMPVAPLQIQSLRQPHTSPDIDKCCWGGSRIVPVESHCSYVNR